MKIKFLPLVSILTFSLNLFGAETSDKNSYYLEKENNWTSYNIYKKSGSESVEELGTIFLSKNITVWTLKKMLNAQLWTEIYGFNKDFKITYSEKYGCPEKIMNLMASKKELSDEFIITPEIAEFINFIIE